MASKSGYGPGWLKMKVRISYASPKKVSIAVVWSNVLGSGVKTGSCPPIPAFQVLRARGNVSGN
jgi:hypothetical protein